MTRNVRVALLVVSALALAPVLVWGLLGLPSFFRFEGPYTEYLLEHAIPERHAANVVMAVTFDYRGLDTLVEESILFTAVMGTALLLRQARDERPETPEEPQAEEGVRLAGLLLVPPIVALGLWVVGHGQVTPGGGFQGGVLLAATALLVYLAGGYAAYRRAAPDALVDTAESAGVLAFLGVGFAGMVAGEAFLFNMLPYGRIDHLDAGGTIAVLSALVGLVVAGGFVLLFTEFLEEVAVVADRGEEE